MPKMNRIKAGEKDDGLRLDIFLVSEIGNLSRSGLKNRLSSIVVNGEESKLSRKIRTGDIIDYKLESLPKQKITAENIQLDVIYEDRDVIVINKAQGMVVHPAAGNYTGTLAQGILYRLNTEKNIFAGDDTRPGIVHRLDKETSGIIIAARNPKSLEFLAGQFRMRSTSKKYLAIINGKLPDKNGVIKSRIGRDRYNRKRMTWKTSSGKDSETEYRVLREWKDISLVALMPKTGRTHQLRVHMLMMNTPICGDPVYSRSSSFSSLMLHAYRLRIILPGMTTHREFRAPLPQRFKDVILAQENSD